MDRALHPRKHMIINQQPAIVIVIQSMCLPGVITRVFNQWPLYSNNRVPREKKFWHADPPLMGFPLYTVVTRTTRLRDPTCSESGVHIENGGAC